MNEPLWLKYEDHLLNEGITHKRISKLKYMFSVANRGLDKPFEKVSREDMEAFVTRLHRDEFKTEKGEHYSGSSKSDIKKFVKQFWKWFKAEDVYPKEVVWIRTRIGKDERPEEKEILSYEDVLKLSKAFIKVEYRVLVLLLFDSGFRIQELMSVKKNDISWEDFEENKKCWWIKCNVSKTITRKIPIALFTEEINAFVNSAYYRVLKDDEIIFNVSYNAINKTIKNVSKKILGKDISPHNFRHSSATYYSRVYEGNMNMIAERYGWQYNSKELQLYIRRSGAYQKAGAKKIYSNEIVKIKEENELLKERLDGLEKEFNIFRKAAIKEILDQIKEGTPSGKKYLERLKK